jgi:Ca-activated chloride channel homolog
MKYKLKACLISVIGLLAVLMTASVAQKPAKNQNKDTPPPTQESDGEVVRVETDLVTTLFTAVDKDRHFITTLRAEDVRISEDGVQQEVSLFERETDRPLTMVVLVDTSRSQERTLADEKRAAKRFIDAVVRPEKDKVAVVSFTGKPKIEAPLSNNIRLIKSAIDKTDVEFPPDGCDNAMSVEDDPRCYTSIWDSVLASSEQLLAPTKQGSRRAIILLSDGDDTSSRNDRDVAIQAAIRNDVVVYGIGIGDPELYKLDKGAMTKLAEKTGGRAFFPAADGELNSAFAQIQDELRSQYVIAYSPKNKTRDGGYRKVKLEVVTSELKKRKLRLLHRQGYYAKMGSPQS